MTDDTPGDARTSGTIPYHALERSRHTIEDFVLSYLPYHSISLPDFFKWWDVLVWVEASIYAIDEDNEAIAQAAVGREPDGVPPALSLGAGIQAGFGALESFLRERHLLLPSIQAELKSGHALFALEDVHATSRSKSFDYRVLHHLACRLAAKPPPSPGLLDFLALDEWLVDIGDDLVDYEDDVERNAFNVYRGYVHLFGSAAPLQLAKHIGELEAAHAWELARLPAAQRGAFLTRKEAAAEGPGALRWVMPPPILDEAAYRGA